MQQIEEWTQKLAELAVFGVNVQPGQLVAITSYVGKEDLTRRVGMSASSFHQWFNGITGMSPLQYQKQLRLQEARSLLRNERKDVATVSRRVGYESASQFSREYSRLFGHPPVDEIGNGNSSATILNNPS